MTGPFLSVLFALGWIVPWFYRTEEPREAFPQYSGTERIVVLLTPLSVTAHMTLSCVLLGRAEDLSAGRVVAGIVVYLGGLAFWLRARSLIGPMRVRRLPDQAPLRLRHDGPFGVVRNPLYLGILLVSAAPVVVLGRPLLLATYSVSFLLFAVRLTYEEERLHQQLGSEYADYCRQVKRLVPFVW